ncbi:MAG TPA: methyltransferase domain-containing protein [Ktedonobacterales bacterium]|jgi:ubiquinone/menaquinone biosynthesis C-methylase UbiE
MPSLHSFAQRHHKKAGAATSKETKGLVLDQGWSYDLMDRLFDPLLFRGQLRALRRRTIDLATLQPGEQALDVGCGTGTLALAVQARVGPTGRVCGVDPSARQIARARAKAARRYGPNAPIDFQIGVIEQLPVADQTFDVVFSTLMMHHLPAPLKRQGLAEIARALKPGGRLVIADFKRKQERQGQATRFHAGGSNVQELAALVRGAGFDQVEIEEMQPRRFSAFPGAGFVSARRG